jgi:hypothetical protein
VSGGHGLLNLKSQNKQIGYLLHIYFPSIEKKIPGKVTLNIAVISPTVYLFKMQINQQI